MKKVFKQKLIKKRYQLMKKQNKIQKVHKQ